MTSSPARAPQLWCAGLPCAGCCVCWSAAASCLQWWTAQTERDRRKKWKYFSDTTLKSKVRGHKHMTLAEHKLSTPLSEIYWVGVVVCYVLGFRSRNKEWVFWECIYLECRNMNVYWKLQWLGVCVCVLVLSWNVSLAVNGGFIWWLEESCGRVLMSPGPSPDITMATATRAPGYCIPELHSGRQRHSRILDLLPMSHTTRDTHTLHGRNTYSLWIWFTLNTKNMWNRIHKHAFTCSKYVFTHTYRAICRDDRLITWLHD